jgi:hypothetical protein
VKYLSRVSIADTVKKIGKALGGSNPEEGYSWYAGSEAEPGEAM